MYGLLLNTLEVLYGKAMGLTRLLNRGILVAVAAKSEPSMIRRGATLFQRVLKMILRALVVPLKHSDPSRALADPRSVLILRGRSLYAQDLNAMSVVGKSIRIGQDTGARNNLRYDHPFQVPL